MIQSKLRQIRHAFSICLGLAIIFTIGCRDPFPPKSNPQNNPNQLRIVCLSPAISQMIIDLDKKSSLIAVHQHDQLATKTADNNTPLPAVGDNTHIDYEKLIALKPTHIILQELKTPIPQKLKSLAQQKKWKIHSFKIDTLQDVWQTLTDTDNTTSLGQILNCQPKATKLRQQLISQQNQLIKRFKTPTPPKALILVFTQPLTAAGPNTYLDEILQIAGATNALKPGPVLYPTLDYEKLLALKPDTIIFFQRANTKPPKLNLPDTYQPQIITISHPKAFLPSTSAIEIAQVLGQKLKAIQNR